MPTSAPGSPAADELEVSVFGPGYGEAIVVHVGAGGWIIVDSCIDPRTRSSAPLSYLMDLGVPMVSVELIVATHWHDDHVSGLATLVEHCANAELVVSQALDCGQFADLVASYLESSVRLDAGVSEFSKALRLLERRRTMGVRFNPPKYAGADRVLYSNSITLGSAKVDVTVHSLSPCDAALLQAQLAFAQAVPRVGERRRPVRSPEPNHAAVALWVRVGHHQILLGADLEETSDPKTRWSVIVAESSVVRGKASSRPQ